MFFDVRPLYTFKPNQKERRLNQWNRQQLAPLAQEYPVTSLKDVVSQDVHTCLSVHCLLGEILALQVSES